MPVRIPWSGLPRWSRSNRDIPPPFPLRWRAVNNDDDDDAWMDGAGFIYVSIQG